MGCDPDLAARYTQHRECKACKFIHPHPSLTSLAIGVVANNQYSHAMKRARRELETAARAPDQTSCIPYASRASCFKNRSPPLLSHPRPLQAPPPTRSRQKPCFCKRLPVQGTTAFDACWHKPESIRLKVSLCDTRRTALPHVQGLSCAVLDAEGCDHTAPCVRVHNPLVYPNVRSEFSRSIWLAFRAAVGHGFAYRSHVDDRGSAFPSGDFMRLSPWFIVSVRPVRSKRLLQAQLMCASVRVAAAARGRRLSREENDRLANF
ncbi:hypothetical protein CDEST_05141 [Colletotrichum destructivum]|uniref:Uncharacterized protein n=1 Tax=Colletotrichum destructivum TaxID=34406 RepID=A0AAX4I9R2_9PEZI|nr:hypothetical protein CDEST_05141 [Colletotrichum destructivum]